MINQMIQLQNNIIKFSINLFFTNYIFHLIDNYFKTKKINNSIKT
jgi:hypothetical protein